MVSLLRSQSEDFTVQAGLNYRPGITDHAAVLKWFMTMGMHICTGTTVLFLHCVICVAVLDDLFQKWAVGLADLLHPAD